MLVNEYKPEFYDRKVRKMGNLGNVYICRLTFVGGFNTPSGIQFIRECDNKVLRLSTLSMK